MVFLLIVLAMAFNYTDISNISYSDVAHLDATLALVQDNHACRIVVALSCH